MTDRVYPSAKTTTTTTNGTTTTAAPPPKSHLYNPTRHPYRPQPHRRSRSRRGCLCLCFFWSVLVLILVLLLAAIAACLLYVLYDPRRPSFSVAALKISQFNLSTLAADDTTHLSSTLNLTITSRNPNKKLIYTYDPFSITAVSNQVEIANGSSQFFTSDPKNTTAIRSTLSVAGKLVDAESVSSLRSDLKRKSGFPVEIIMDTKVVVKLEKLKSKKLGIRVTCGGIRGFVPKGKIASVASTSDAKCKVDLRIKIWKWTF